MTKTITIDGENYEVNVEAAIKAGLLKKAVTHTTGDFYIKLKYFEFIFVTAGNGRRSIKSLAMGCQT